VETAEASPVTGRSVFAPALQHGTPLRVLAIHTSSPLIEVLDVINRRSHNLMAEQVLRTVGRVALGEGSVEAGAEAVSAMLDSEIESPSAAIRIYDGSGLSVLNRASARTIIHLLSFVARSPMWESYWSTLPEAGSTNGLRRMQRTAADGKLRAKTGTINRVSALSGYVRARNDEVLAFSIISNDVGSTWRAKRVEDAIGARLASFNRPALVELAAAPTPAQGEDPPADTSATPSIPAPPASGPQEHEIQRGETLDGIARRYGTTVAALEGVNPGLDPRRLIPGRSVRLPSAASPSAEAPASPSTQPAAEHTIRPGDTLDGIARRYDTTVEALRAANPGLNPRRLIPGRTVRLPGG